LAAEPSAAAAPFGRGWTALSDPAGAHQTDRFDAELLLVDSTLHPEHRALRLELEGVAPGPSACAVEFRDEWDGLLAKCALHGRQVVSVPLPRRRKGRRVSVHIRPEQPGDAGPGHGDFAGSKIRAGGGNGTSSDPSPALRVLRWEFIDGNAGGSCGANGRGADAAPSRDAARPGEHTSDEAGIRFVRGWTETGRQGSPRSRDAEACADILLNPPGCVPHVLALDVEPLTRSGDRPTHLSVHDQEGRCLSRFWLTARCTIEVVPALTRQGAAAIRLVVDGPGRGSSEPALRVHRAEWRGRVREAGSRNGRQPLDRPTRFASPDTKQITSPEFLHTHACGDFTLMDRESWFRLRAYPELQLFSFHLDSIFCYAAHYAGVRQEILPDTMGIYHIEHSVGSGWTPHGHNTLFERIAAKGIPFVEDNDLWTWALQMRRLQAPIIFNLDDWGFANDLLPETTMRGTHVSTK
jgi:hypothetical protein